MKKLIFFIAFILPLFGYTQKLDTKVYDGRILKTKDQVKTRTEDYRRIQKEYDNYLKERHRRYKALQDSLCTADSLSLQLPPDSINKLSKLQEEYFVYTDSIYSLTDLSNLGDSKKTMLNESVGVVKEKLSGNRFSSRFGRLKHEISNHRQVLRQYRDSLRSIDSLDKAELDYLVQRRKQELSKEYEGELKSITGSIVNEKLPDLPDGFQNEELAQFQKAHGYLAQGLEKPQLANLSKAQSIDHFRDKQEVLDKARIQVAKLKKTYSEVSDIHDLSTAKKISSLAEKSFPERLVYGGTFQLHVDGNTKVDLNPEVSYRINRTFEAGFGGTYRLTVATKKLPQSIDDPMVMGVRGFAKHKLIKSFYVHGEYEGLKGSTRKLGDLTGKEWHYSFLAGIERRFNLKGKMQGQGLVLYNFNTRGNPLYSSPWVFRVGFRVSGKE